MEKIKSQIESILFISGEPVKISRIAKIVGVENPEVENAVLALKNEYALGKRGLSIIQKDGEIQMATSPENSALVEQLVKSEMQEGLSKASLEVLSIIAYRGPVSRAAIEAIRGVNCSFTVRSLLMRGLVDRIDNPGDARGYLYRISFDFLKKLGVDDVRALPDFETLSKDDRIDSIIGE